MTRILTIIPARMASSRFPGKPLVPIAGVHMIDHVRHRAAMAPGVTHVWVATCDTEIMEHVQQGGGHAVMTSDRHERCTDRIEEAVRDVDEGVVVMVQGDEPLLLPEDLEAVIQPILDDSSVMCTNLLSPLEHEEERAHPDIVKAAVDRAGRVMLLTRAPIPYARAKGESPVYRQTGIMAFRLEALRQYTSLAPTPLEIMESVDMLRFLEHGQPIQGVVVDHGTQGVDRPADVETVERALRADPRQAQLHAAVLERTKRSRGDAA